MLIDRTWKIGGQDITMTIWLERDKNCLMMSNSLSPRRERLADIAPDQQLVAFQLSVQAPPAVLYILRAKDDPTKIALHYDDLLHNQHAVYHERLLAGQVIMAIEADPSDYEKFVILIQQPDGEILRKPFKGNYWDVPEALWQFHKQRGQEKLLASLPPDLAAQVRQAKKKP